MPDLTIVGAGIVGLSCAWAAQRRGWRVSLIDRDFEGDRASHGNAGGIAVSECIPLSLAGLGLKPIQWLLDPLGPLAVRAGHAPRLLPWFLALRRVARPANYLHIATALAALNRLAMHDFEALMADIGLSAELHKRGALTVYETQAAFAKESAEWQLKRSLGVRWRPVDSQELRALEPHLAPVFAQAVMQEDWAHVDDPLRIVQVLRQCLVARGARLITGDAAAVSFSVPDRPAAVLSDSRRCEADKLVIAAGAWSARLAQSAGDRVLLESERGYNTTLPASARRLSREVIFAERKFVATPLTVGLRIGGAAEFAGLDAPANYRRSDALLRLARRYLPGLNESGAKQWMGQRPATPDSLPVVGPAGANPRLLYAFGHGHLGLTQAATTGEMIANLLDGSPQGLDLAPYSIKRF